MHLREKSKQSYFLQDLRQKYRSISLLHQQNQSSLEQSPIPTKFRQDSDHSPQQFLYPESLVQRSQNPMPKVIDLKKKVLDLLCRLKHWLEQLSLTDSLSSDINEQLQPIIQQIKEISQQSSNDSQLFSSGANIQKKVHDSVYLKDSHSYHFSGNIDKQCERHQSFLIQQSREKSQIWLINQNEKNLVRIFFRRYYRLLQNCLLKINRYCGEKKLKFLLETNLRNIFSQTLRISYDLKVIEHKLKEERLVRLKKNRKQFTRVLIHRIQQLLQDRGEIKNAFSQIKTLFFEQIDKDQKLISQMHSKLKVLNNSYKRTRHSNLQSFLFKWRQSTQKLKIQQQLFLTDYVRETVENILSDLINFGQNARQFATNWRAIIEGNFNKLCTGIFERQQCIYIDMLDLLNEKCTKKEKYSTLAQFLEESRGFGEEDASRISKSFDFFSQLTVQQIRACILSGQVYKKQNIHQNILLIPLKPTSGIIFIKLDSRHHNITRKQSMNISSFRSLLRIVQLITPALQDICNAFKRIQSCWTEVQKKDYYSILLKQFLKVNIINKQQGHLQIQCNQSQIAIDSNRLQSSSTAAQQIMQKCQIDNLMIYHSTSGTINQMPCIIHGDRQFAATQRFIINSIYQELLSCGKQHLVINRNGQIFNILPLRSGFSTIGLVHFSITTGEKIDITMISKCLVPLLLRCDGKMECSHCKVSLRLPQKQKRSDHTSLPQEKIQKKIDFSFSSATKLITTSSLTELQRECSDILRQKGNFFHKNIYKLDLSDSETFYSSDGKDSYHIHTIKQNEKVIHKQIFIEDYTSSSNYSSFAKIAFQSPCFPNPQLHIYQHENQLTFRLIAIPIKNEDNHYGYFLAGFYIQDQSLTEEIIQFLQKLVYYLNSNKTVFRSIKINDISIQQHFNNQNAKINQEVCDLIFKGDSFLQRGKLCIQIKNIINNFLRKGEQLSMKQAINVRLLKLNSKNRSLKSLYSTKQNEKTMIQISSDIVSVLKQNKLIQSHERLYSDDFILNKNAFNRTIKPIKLQKLSSIQLFFPKWSKQSSKSFYEIIDNKFKLKGLLANQNFEMLQQIDTKLSGRQFKGNKSYSFSWIGQRGTESYFLFTQQALSQSFQKSITNKPVIQQLQKLAIEAFQRSKIFNYSSKQKKQSIINIANIIGYPFNKQYIVKAFKNNLIYKKTISMKFVEKLQAFIPDQMSKNIKYYNVIANAFVALKKFNNVIENRYQFFMKRIIPVLNQYQRKISITYAFQLIKKSVQNDLNISIALSKVFCVLKKSIISLQKEVFPSLKAFSCLQHQNSILRKRLSIKKLQNHLTNLINRRIYMPFFDQICKSKIQFKQSFELILEQFQSVKFNSRQSFLAFTNQRFNTIIQHICFGSIIHLEIGVSQTCSNRLILYRRGVNTDIEEVVVDKTFSTQLNIHNDYVFLPIGSELPNNHYLIYKLRTKEFKSKEEIAIVEKIIKEGAVPAYRNYLQSQLQRASKICDVMSHIFCKEIWNGSIDDAQKTYVFGRKQAIQEKSDKLKVFLALKTLRRSQQINELRLIRGAINEETRQLYRLQYQCHSIGNALASIPLSQQQLWVYQKYSGFVSRDQIRSTREITQCLDEQNQKKMLQYQIKSKTFATSKIIAFCDRRQKSQLQKISLNALIEGSENNRQNTRQADKLQKAVVQGRMLVNDAKNKAKELRKKQKIFSARSIWLSLARIKNNNAINIKQSAFSTLLCPLGKLRA